MSKHIIRLDFEGSSGAEHYTPEYALSHTNEVVSAQMRADATKTVKRISSPGSAQEGAGEGVAQGYTAEGVTVYQKVEGPDMTFKIGFPYHAIDGPLFSSHDLTETQAVYMTMRAEQEIQKILRADPEAQIEVVSVGYSRGGVSASIFQRNLQALYSDSDQVRSRLLQIDPVSGGLPSVSKRMQAAFDVENDGACHPQLVEHLREVRPSRPATPPAPEGEALVDSPPISEFNEPLDPTPEQLVAISEAEAFLSQPFAQCSVIYSLNSSELSKAIPERAGFIPQEVQGANQIVLTDLGHASVLTVFAGLSYEKIVGLQRLGDGVFTPREITKDSHAEAVLREIDNSRLAQIPVPEGQDQAVIEENHIDQERRRFAQRARDAGLTPRQAAPARLKVIAGAVASVEHQSYRSPRFIDLSERHMNQAIGMAVLRRGASFSDMQDSHEYTFSPSAGVPWANGLKQSQIDDLDAHIARKTALSEKLFDHRVRVGLLVIPQSVHAGGPDALSTYKAAFVGNDLANTSYEELQSHCDLFDMKAEDFNRLTSELKILCSRAYVEPFELKIDGTPRRSRQEALHEFSLRCYQLGKAKVEALVKQAEQIGEVLDFEMNNLPEGEIPKREALNARYRALAAMPAEELNALVLTTREASKEVAPYEVFGEISPADAKLLRQSLADGTDSTHNKGLEAAVAVQALALYDFRPPDPRKTPEEIAEERQQYFKDYLQALNELSFIDASILQVEILNHADGVEGRKDMVVGQDSIGQPVSLGMHMQNALRTFNRDIYYAPNTGMLRLKNPERESITRILLKRPVVDFTSHRIENEMIQIADVCEGRALLKLMELRTSQGSPRELKESEAKLLRENALSRVKDFVTGEKNDVLVQEHGRIKELVHQWHAFQRENPGLSPDERFERFATRAAEIIMQQRIFEEQQLAASTPKEKRLLAERHLSDQEYVYIAGHKAFAYRYGNDSITPELAALMYENAFGALPTWATANGVQPERFTDRVVYPAQAVPVPDAQESEVAAPAAPIPADIALIALAHDDVAPGAHALDAEGGIADQHPEVGELAANALQPALAPPAPDVRDAFEVGANGVVHGFSSEFQLRNSGEAPDLQPQNIITTTGA
jgi:hypothetical protein